MSLIISIPFQILIFLVICSTQTKGVILSVIIFFLFSFIILNGRKRFMIISFILFIIVLFITSSFNVRKLIKYPLISQSHIIQTEEEIPAEPITKKLYKSRLNLVGALGRSSIDSRLKAIKVSLIYSLKNIWFGHGAGLSQKLLPKMIIEYDLKNSFATEENRQYFYEHYYDGREQENFAVLQHKYYTGESFQNWVDRTVNHSTNTLIDTHNLILTHSRLHDIFQARKVSLNTVLSLLQKTHKK